MVPHRHRSYREIPPLNLSGKIGRHEHTRAQLFDLTGQTALVTGGSRGLGLQMAEALGEAGAKIMLTSRKAADLEEAARTCRRAGIDARWIAADASKPGRGAEGGGRNHGAPGPHRHPGQQRRRHLGRAGRGLPAGGLGQGDEPEHPQPLPVCQAVAKASMIPASTAASSTSPASPAWAARLEMKFIAYGTSKGAVVNFTRTLAAEWGALRHHRQRAGAGLLPEQDDTGRAPALGADKLAAAAPLQRLGDDDDLKGAALLFASAAGKHITGQILAVDGGVSAVHGGG
jgi:NAD(P)-dependent dehydrogenase (short-subunit alcohol dehydrogenase family)